MFPSRRTLRLTAYLVTVCLCASALAGRVVYGKAKEAALSFGEQLAGLPDLTRGANVVLVNGERFHRATVITDDSLSSVLDRVQADCETTPGLLGQAAAEAAREHPAALKKVPLNASILHGIVRDDEGTRGMVACFTDSRISGLKALSEAAQRFAKNANLSEFGHFRYAFAHRTRDGKTLVSTLWADSDLNLSTMFPAVGDAAGEDSRVLPRPNASRRTLSACAEDEPYAVRLYDSSDSPAAIQLFYDGWMKKQGWQPVGKRDGKGAGYLRSDGYQAIISFAQRDGRTTVGLTEAGRAEGSTVEVDASAALR